MPEILHVHMLRFNSKMKEKIEAELRDTYRRISELQEENTRLHVENGSIGLLVQAPTSLSQLQWKQCSKIPVKMTRGSACSHNNMVYFNPCFSNIVHCYKLTTEMNRMPVSGSCRPTNASNVKKSAEDSSKLNVPIADTPSEEEEGKWSVLPSSPYKHFSLAVVRGQLITIGGVMPNTQKTASVLSLTEGEQWVEQLPPMPTKRCYTTAATSGKQLAVLGGEGEGSKKLTTVEVMNTSTEQWQCAECLPVPLTIASSAVCAGQLYIGGGFNKSTEEDSSVYTCSLARLITQPAQRSKSLSLSDRGEQKVWRAIQNIPLAGATLVCVHGQLLALGGRTRRSARNSNLVHRLVPYTNKLVYTYM